MNININNALFEIEENKYKAVLDSEFINYDIVNKSNEQIIEDAIRRSEKNDRLESSCCIYQVGEIIQRNVPSPSRREPIVSRLLTFYSLNNLKKPSFQEKISCFIYPMIEGIAATHGNELRSTINGHIIPDYTKLERCLSEIKGKEVLMDCKIVCTTSFRGVSTSFDISLLHQEISLRANFIRTKIKKVQIELLKKLLQKPVYVKNNKVFEEVHEKFVPIIKSKIAIIEDRMF